MSAIINEVGCVQSEYSKLVGSVGIQNNLKFWSNAKSILPKLYVGHCKVQSICPTLCGIESAFSIAVMSSGVKGRRSNLFLISLEKEGICRFNRDL